VLDLCHPRIATPEDSLALLLLSLSIMLPPNRNYDRPQLLEQMLLLFEFLVHNGLVS